MRARFLTSAAAIAMATTPALAADLYTPTYVPPINDPVYTPGPAVVGHLSLGIGLVNIDSDDIFDFDDTAGVFTGAGRANVNMGGAWNVELETGGFAFFKDGDSYSSIGVAGHLWTRLNSAAVGVYAAGNFPTGVTIGTVGVEGEAYIGNITVGGTAGYNWGDGFDFWDLAGWADFYFTPDFRVGGKVEYANGDGGDAWGVEVDTEYRFSGTPFSGWAEVAYADNADIWSGLIGFRVFMDAPSTSLQQHDQEVPWDTGLLSSNLILNF